MNVATVRAQILVRMLVVAGRAQISTGFVARLSPDGVWK